MKEEILCTEDGFEDLYNDETLNELADALEKLPPRECDVIVLHYYSGKSPKEIAGLMQMSCPNLKSLRKKALVRLRKLLQFQI